MEMKNVFYFLLVLVNALIPGRMEILAQTVSRNDALIVAGNFIRLRNPGMDISRTELLMSGQDSLAWIMHCQPRGFIVISSNPDLQPVLAWSAEGNFSEGGAWDSFLPILKYDLKIRNRYAEPGSSEAQVNRQKWEYWKDPSSKKRSFQQWPSQGWSPTEGWLFTNWTQSAPYNALCPIDGQTSIRSIAGCPATTMAQILNFHHDLHQTRFTDADDYYHNYGAGNMYWIDNDWESHGFPSWDQLNTYLDTLDTHYQNAIELSNTDKAALTYACGVAARQVYSSSGSGTYGISQAYDAYIRFGYADANLVVPEDPDLNIHLAQNIMIALPAHLGLVNPEWTVGHNVVVDGYNTDEFYHFNFGWGGSANGWYTMPPNDIPYNLTVIEGIVLDINLSNPPVGISPGSEAVTYPEMIYINENHALRIRSSDLISHAMVEIFDATGQLVEYRPISMHGSGNQTDLKLPRLKTGIYIARLETGNGNQYSCKFICKSEY